jgi:hypothetical protein
VIVFAMVAVAFGSYAASLFIGDAAATGWDNVFTSLVIVGMAAINLLGSRPRVEAGARSRRAGSATRGIPHGLRPPRSAR